jgi:hypothetical protein
MLYLSADRVQQAARARVGRRQVTEEEKARQTVIEQFTGAATSIMSVEADVFDLHKEEIEHSIKMQALVSLQPLAGASAT